MLKGHPSPRHSSTHAEADGAVTGVAEHALHEQARVVGATAEAAAVLEGAGAQQPITASTLRETLGQGGRGGARLVGGAKGKEAGQESAGQAPRQS